MQKLKENGEPKRVKNASKLSNVFAYQSRKLSYKFQQMLNSLNYSYIWTETSFFDATTMLQLQFF